MLKQYKEIYKKLSPEGKTALKEYFILLKLLRKNHG